MNKNISLSLFEIIKNAPSLEEAKHEDHMIEEKEAGKEESKVFESVNLLDTKVISNEIFGYLLAWNALFQKLYKGKLKLRLEPENEYLVLLRKIEELI